LGRVDWSPCPPDSNDQTDRGKKSDKGGALHGNTNPSGGAGEVGFQKFATFGNT
jgi:hypothetical protein